LYQTINNGSREKLANYSYDVVGRQIQKKIMPNGTYTTGGVPASIMRPPNPSPNTNDVATQYICLQPGVFIDANSLNSYIAQIGTGGGGNSISGLQTIDYQYHIRNWLIGINLDGNGNPNPNTNQGDLFSYKLDYETSGYFDGNIGQQTWNNDTAQRNYQFSYDNANRLKSATYGGINGENYSLPNLNYDKNDNITTLQRNGKVGSGFGQMDNLSYAYSGNRLTNIIDNAGGGDNTVDFVPRGGGNYTYYNDGSLKSDDNKEITQINYDSFLQLPSEIQLTGGRWIKMYYDGDGVLLKREFSTGEYWEYANGMVYKNGQPHEMNMPEGRATYQNGNWALEFFYQDHLGNTRVSFKANGNQLEKTDETSCDPTGVVLNGIGQENSIENRFKHQDKESLALFGLGGINDFGARYLDKTIGGRWWSTDPMGELHFDSSPFRYVLNNPLRYIDPFGLDTLSSTAKGFKWDNVKGGDIVDGTRVLSDVTVYGTKHNADAGENQGISDSSPTQIQQAQIGIPIPVKPFPVVPIAYPRDRTYDGNDNRNPNSHYIYFIFYRLRGNTNIYGVLAEEQVDYFVEKYGIGQEFDKGNRVRNQVRRLNRDRTKTINGLYVFDYDLLHRNVRGRWAAKFVEMKEATGFYYRHGYLPAGQDLPTPFSIPKIK